jgi:hypothetical protein
MFIISERKQILERKEVNEKLIRELEVREQQCQEEVDDMKSDTTWNYDKNKIILSIY